MPLGVRVNSVAWRSQGDPWLCVPASRPVCLSRCLTEATEEKRGSAVALPNQNSTTSQQEVKFRESIEDLNLEDFGSPLVPPPRLPSVLGEHRFVRCRTFVSELCVSQSLFGFDGDSATGRYEQAILLPESVHDNVCAARLVMNVDRMKRFIEKQLW